MIDYQDLKPDCRHFRPDRPCKPHKQRGAVCPTCDEYDPFTRRVLIVKLAALGDVLRTTSLLPAVRERFPGAHITWLTAEEAVPLLRGNDLVDEVWSAESAVTAARLRSIEFDTVLCPDADPEAVALAAAARCGERFGFTLDSRGRVVPLGADAEHWFRMGLSDPLKRSNTETYQTLIARVLGLDPASVGRPTIEPSTDQQRAAEEFVTRLGFDGPLVGLNTGSGGRWEFKQWTFEHQREFIRIASQHGAGVVLLGGPNEAERHRELLAVSEGAALFDAGTDNSFGQFAAIVDRCAALVTGDTFAMHVATARAVPAVVLFGPTSAVEIELYGCGTKLTPDGLDCLGCYLPRCDVDPHCQARIQPETVWGAVESVLVEGLMSAFETELRALRLIHAALAAGPLLFAAVVFYLTMEGLGPETSDEMMPLAWVAAGSVFVAIPAAWFVRQQLCGSSGGSERERFDRYRVAVVAFAAILEGAALLCVTAWLVTGEGAVCGAGAGVAWTMLVAASPSLEQFESLTS